MNGAFKSTNPNKSEDSKELQAYVDVIVEKGEQYHIPVLNLFDQLGIDPDVESDKEKYTIDGLHLNDEGHKKLAECVTAFLQNL